MSWVIATAITPASVAANTTAEHSFTVINLLPGDSVSVGKPSFQAGLGIVNARVSAANTLAITFSNNTASAIVPASETYTLNVTRAENVVNGLSVLTFIP